MPRPRARKAHRTIVSSSTPSPRQLHLQQSAERLKMRLPLAKGPAGNHGSRLRAELARRGQNLPLLGNDDVQADGNYIKQFVLTRRRTLGQQYGVESAEAFHYISSRGPRRTAVDEYVEDNAVPLK